MLFLAAKLRKRKLALSVYVSLCQSMSLYVTFRSIASFSLLYNKGFIFGENGLVSRINSGDLAGKCADFNSQQKIALRAENNCSSYSDILGAGGYFLRICAIFCRYWTCTFSGRNNQAIGPRLSAIFTFFFTMQSYEKEIWHCPHMSAYVRKCPLLSAFLSRCKVTKSKFGTVQICPIMSKFVHLILRRFHFLPKLFGICLENAYLCTQEDKQDNYENKVYSSPFGSFFEPHTLLAGFQ